MLIKGKWHCALVNPYFSLVSALNKFQNDAIQSVSPATNFIFTNIRANG
jgi:hypothetical protein